MCDHSWKFLRIFLFMVWTPLFTMQATAQRFPPPEPKYEVLVKRSVRVPCETVSGSPPICTFRKGQGRNFRLS